jgi:signal transduction histidine kinase
LGAYLLLLVPKLGLGNERKDSRVRSLEGTGLGLAIAQKIVRAHGGCLRVRSELGRGSTFEVIVSAAGGDHVINGTR